MAFAEGSANDWLPIGIVDGYGVASSTGAAFYVVFVAAMTAGRLLGGRVIDRYGRSVTVRWSAVLAVAGILTVILAGNLILAALGRALWGVVVALDFPLTMSASAESDEGAARRPGGRRPRGTGCPRGRTDARDRGVSTRLHEVTATIRGPFRRVAPVERGATRSEGPRIDVILRRTRCGVRPAARWLRWSTRG